MSSAEIRTPLSHQNLRRLCGLRYAAVVFGAAIVVIANRQYHFGLAEGPVFSLLAAVAAINTGILIRAYKTHPVSELELFGYIVFDVAVLTGLLYMTGGSTNPFVMMYLVPLALIVITLPKYYAWGMALLVIACYSALMFYYLPLSSEGHEHHDRDFSLHIAGMWFDFMLSAALIAWLGTRMAETVRKRDAQLASLREAELRKERVVALGALAAGTAHELGTPLATLSILAGELEPGVPLSTSTVQVLREQIERCKNILNTMATSAGAVRAQSGRKTALDDFLKAIVSSWQKNRPQANLVSAAYTGKSPAPHIISEQTLAQAITNLLNNAADASPDHVEFDCRWTDDELSLRVADCGPGLKPELAERVGEDVASSKTGGMGLGLFLTYATVERLGGAIQLFQREGGGTVCQLTLPLRPLTLTS